LVSINVDVEPAAHAERRSNQHRTDGRSRLRGTNKLPKDVWDDVERTLASRI
jgi:hypothetical protein